MGNRGGKIVLTEEIVENISKSSGQDKASVRKQCENFIEKHPKGSMSKSEFKEFLKQALPNLNMQALSHMILNQSRSIISQEAPKNRTI